MSESILNINKIKKTFGGFTAVKDVDLKVGRGEIRFIIGPNGAGKSTLFKLIIGHLKPDYGDAYNNIGAAILSKTETIIEEMNKNLSDFNKYDKLQAKQFDVYREALPYYESAFKYDNQNIGVVQTLMGIYENLEMTDKLKEIRPVYEELKQ